MAQRNNEESCCCCPRGEHLQFQIKIKIPAALFPSGGGAGKKSNRALIGLLPGVDCDDENDGYDSDLCVAFDKSNNHDIIIR